MAATDEQVRRVVEAYAAQQANLITGLVRMLLGLWLPFRWWNRPDMVNATAAQSAVYVDVAAEKARLLARAYMMQMLAAVDAAPSKLSAFENVYPRSGTPVVEVYKRPARQVEYKIREAAEKALAGAPAEPVQIEKILTERIEQIVSSDIATAARDEQKAVLDQAPEKVIGWRRVIHPELSKTGTCGLCVVASTRFYTREDLLEIHANCKCTVAPLTATNDPGLKLNRDDLDALYEAAGSNYAEDLKKIVVQTVEHGELGPILTRKGDQFKTVRDVNRQTDRHDFTPYTPPTRGTDADTWSKMADSSRRSIRILEDAKRRGTNLVDMAGTGREVPVRDLDAAIAYHRSLIARSAAHAA